MFVPCFAGSREAGKCYAFTRKRMLFFDFVGVAKQKRLSKAILASSAVPKEIAMPCCFLALCLIGKGM